MFKQTTKYEDVYMQHADLFCKDLWSIYYYPADRLKHVLQCDVQTTTNARQWRVRGLLPNQPNRDSQNRLMKLTNSKANVGKRDILLRIANLSQCGTKTKC